MIDLSKYKKLIPLKECSIYELASILEGHAEELLAEVERLQKMVESMRCCANCMHVSGKGMGNICELDDRILGEYEYCCDKWESIE